MTGVRECGWARTTPRAVWLGSLLFFPALEPGDLRLCGPALGPRGVGIGPASLEDVPPGSYRA